MNIPITDDEGLNLAKFLIQAARETREFTVKADRKQGSHRVTLSYEPRAK